MYYSIIFTRPAYKPRMGGVTTYLRELLLNVNKELFNIVGRETYLANSTELRSSTVRENFLIKLNVLVYLLAFPYKLIKHKIDIVHANPSFGFIPLIRDSFFILVTSFLRKKILVFIHGWRSAHAERIIDNKLMHYLFTSVFNRADAIIVLAEGFKHKLREMGITKRIIVETTMVSDDLVEGVEIKTEMVNYNDDRPIRILFLSRIHTGKGIYETVDCIEILSRKYNNIKLIIAGTGPDLTALRAYVRTKKLLNIEFIGFVSGEEKRKVFDASDVYLFPSHEEGMPISVLEAMAFGLPIVTRPVGALKDFFEDGKHGFITESRSPEILASLLEKLISNKKLRHDISNYNFHYARTRFLASKVSKRLENIYSSLLSKTF